MKASQLIEMIQSRIDKHGDLPIETHRTSDLGEGFVTGKSVLVHSFDENSNDDGKRIIITLHVD